MGRVDVLWTLEDLFYNIDNLTMRDILEWIMMKYPHLTEKEILNAAGVVHTLHRGWKEGKFFIRGDNVGLRDQSKN
jgi:hypothetical protein